MTATVPDLSSHDEMLLIDGSATGLLLVNCTKFTNNSPVAHWINGFSSESQGKGDAKLQLSLQLPLAHALDTKVNGALQFMNNDVLLQKEIPPITNRDQDRRQRSDRWFARRLSASGDTKTAGAHMATVTERDHHVELLIDSGLQGIGLDFPEPLRKNASEAMPLKFEWVGVASEDALIARDELRLALGSTIVACYQRQKASVTNVVESSADTQLNKQAIKAVDWKLVRGGIGINTPVPEPDIF